jgi:regulator of RNase E activity RraA
MQEPGFSRLSYAQLFEAIEKSPKPAYIVLKQDFPDEEIKKRCGPTGGMLCTAFKKLGAVGLLTDGPVRDIEEIRPMKFQYMSNGVAPGHGVVCVRAVNVPVRVCGVDFAPGEIVHTDINGAVKFTLDKLEEVAERLNILSDYEKKRAAMVEAAEPTAEAVKKAFFTEIDGIK